MRRSGACLATTLLLVAGCAQPTDSDESASVSPSPDALNASLVCDDPDLQATTYLDYEPGTGETDKESAMRVAQQTDVLARGDIEVGDGPRGRVVGADGATLAEVHLEQLDAGWVVSTIESCG